MNKLLWWIQYHIALYYVPFSIWRLVKLLIDSPSVHIGGLLLSFLFAIVYLVIGVRIAVHLEGADDYVAFLYELRGLSLKTKFLHFGFSAPTEELAFRGSFLEFFLCKFNGNYLISISVSTILFVVGHTLGKGREFLRNLITLAFFSILASVLVVIFPGNLWYPIVMHVSTHLLMFFFTPVLIWWVRR